MDWTQWQAAAAIISSLCAVVAATVSVMVWRKAKSGDLAAKIDNGDKATRKHTDRSVSEIKTDLRGMTHRMGELEDGMARIEASQQQHLTARDLSPLHEKINRVGEQIAGNTASTQAVREQLRVIHEHLMRGRP